MNEYTNKRLKRVIKTDDEGTVFERWFKNDDDSETAAYIYGGTMLRDKAFEWLHGKDAATRTVTRATKLEIVAAKVRADAELIIETCEAEDSWLEHLYGDRNRVLSVRPIQR